MYRLKLLYFLPLLMVFSSCMKDLEGLQDIKGVTLRSEIAVPLLVDEIGVREMYEQFSQSAYIKEETDQSMTFVYSTTDSLEQRQFVTMPPLGVSLNIETDAAMAFAFNTVGSLSQTISNTAEINMSNSEQLKTLLVKSGLFVINVSSDFKHNTRMVFTFPGIKKDGNILSDTVTLNYAGVSPIVVSKQIDIAGYEIDFTNGGTEVNKIPYSVSLDVNRVTGNPPMQAGEKLTINNLIEVLKYRKIVGYLGKFVLLSTNEEIPIDLFYRQAGGKIYFNNPSLLIKLNNGFGVPITGKITQFYAKLMDGSTIPVQVDLFKDTFSIVSPVNPGDFVVGEYLFSKSNSNIDEILNNSPSSLGFRLDFTANYDDVVKNNFLFDTSSIKTFMDVQMPLDLKVDNYIVKQFGDFGFPQVANIGLEDVKMMSRAYNEMPVGVNVQLYFAKKAEINNVDSFYVVDSLFVNGLDVPPAKVDANGVVIQQNAAISTGLIEAARYQRMQTIGCDYYYMEFRVNSSRDNAGGHPFTKIYAHQKVGIQVGMEARAKLSSLDNKQ